MVLRFKTKTETEQHFKKQSFLFSLIVLCVKKCCVLLVVHFSLAHYLFCPPQIVVLVQVEADG